MKRIFTLFSLLLISVVLFSQSITITADQSMDESNLDDRILYLELTSETFADATLDVLNFSLNNVPVGTSIDSVTYESTDSAVVYLGFNGTDFDMDSTHVSVTILATELAGSSNLTSNELTISCIIEVAGITVVADSVLEESRLDYRSLNIILSNEVFADNILDPANFTLNNVPVGVTIEAVNYNTINSASLDLAFDGTDFDADSVHFSITIAGTEFSGGIDVTSNELSIYAINELTTIAISPDQMLSEDNLDDRYINIAITNDYFIDNILDNANFTLNNFPTGVTLDSVIYIDSLMSKLYIAFDGTDFDTDSVNCSITIAAAELNNGTNATSNSVTAYANTETAALSITSDTTLIENILNGRILTLSLMYETYADQTLDMLNFTINNEPAGISIDSVKYHDNTSSYMYLSFDSTNFDIDSTHVSITILGSELTGGSDLTSSEFTIYSVDEDLLQAVQDAIDSTSINLPNSVTTLIGSDISIDIVVDYPDTFNVDLTNDYLVDILINTKFPLLSTDSIFIAYESTVLDTLIPTGGQTEFWISESINSSRTILANDTDATWTIIIRGLVEMQDTLYAQSITALSSDFNDPSKRNILSEDMTIITVYESITINTNPSDITECTKYSVTFSTDATSNSALTYQWRKNGSNISGANLNTFTILDIASSDAGNYDCVISNNYHFEITSSATLTTLQSPNVDLQDEYFITTDQVTIMAVTAGYSSYLWNTGSTSHMIAVEGSVLGYGAHTYWVSVTDNSNSCNITDTTIVNVNYGLSNGNTPEMAEVSIYPNPASNFISVRSKNNIFIEVTDMNGKVLIQKKEMTTNENLINLESFPVGTFVMTIYENNDIRHIKFVKQ